MVEQNTSKPRHWFLPKKRKVMVNFAFKGDRSTNDQMNSIKLFCSLKCSCLLTVVSNTE